MRFAYYDKLSSDPFEGVERVDTLPPLAVQWAREAEDGPAAGVPTFRPRVRA